MRQEHIMSSLLVVFVPLIIVACPAQEDDIHVYSECPGDGNWAYYSLREVHVDGEVVANGIHAPSVLLRRSYRTDAGLLNTIDTGPWPSEQDADDDYGLDLSYSLIWYVRK